MSINFNRNRAQLFYENLIGAAPEDLISKREEFKNHVLTESEAGLLKQVLKEDAIDFFYNGVLSFSEGIDAVFQKRFSWATIKLYYSIYYLIRATLASKDIAMLRCKSMYRLKARTGEKPYGTGNRKYNTTHEGTINHYRDIFNMSDRLLSNKIEDDDAYEWMMNAREIVNYRSASFSEPDCLDIWDYFAHCIDEGTLSEALESLENDPYVMCFQEEYAVVAIPIKRMQQTITDILASGILQNLSEDRALFAKTVIGYDERSLSVLSEIFS